VIVIKVELHSAVTGKMTELARMLISNTGDNPNPRWGDYIAQVIRGRSKEQLDKGTVLKQVTIFNHPRQQLHVWNLVAKALSTMGYGR
jgi:hypothetical protein